MRRAVVVGASLAGLRAAEALRREGFAGELVLIGAEPHLPYDRPPLSKQLLRGEWLLERLRLRSDQDLSELGIELRLGVRAIGLDGAARNLRLSDGSELTYDGLVIATGATPRVLPFGHELRGVHVLRTLDDALQLKAALVAKPRVCVVGAGFIGLEVAASCRMLGLEVTAVEPLPLPLENKLGEPMAQRLVQLHRERGVVLRSGIGVTALEGGTQVERVRLADGTSVEAELVVVGVGVRPMTDWLEGSDVALQDGVLCDAMCATTLPDVVAAGDVARWYNPRFGQAMRVEHFTHAVEMANHAARRLLAGPAFAEPFQPVPYFWSDQYDVKLQFAGSFAQGDAFELIEDVPHERKCVALYGRNGVLTGVLGWNRPAQLVRYRKLIAENTPWEDALAQARR